MIYTRYRHRPQNHSLGSVSEPSDPPNWTPKFELGVRPGVQWQQCRQEVTQVRQFWGDCWHCQWCTAVPGSDVDTSAHLCHFQRVLPATWPYCQEVTQVCWGAPTSLWESANAAMEATNPHAWARTNSGGCCSKQYLRFFSASLL